MADIIYTVNQDLPEDIFGFEQYSQEDRDLIPSFQINSVFDPGKHYSELYILSLSDEILESVPNYTNYTQLGNAQSAGQDGASVLTIDPIADAKAYGYSSGGVKLLYHFLDDLYTQDSTTSTFYIQEISPDRTEISLASTTIAPEVLTSTTANIKSNLQSQSYFSGFRLNFTNNDLFIATNIDTLSSDKGIVVVVKLYEPLPTTYNVKSKLNIVDLVADSAVYEVDAEFVIEPEVAPTLKAPNFNIEVADESVVPTGYANYNELFNYSVTNKNSELYSLIKEKSININVNYEDFSSFVHFSSAQERLLNFKYKVDLLTSYSSSIALIDTSTTGLQGISGSRSYYEGLTTGVLGSFDHYERFLYYESGSSSWPKSNTTKPYTNIPSKDPITNVPNSTTTAWFTAQTEEALLFDQNNNNSLVYSIPAFLRDDDNNERYLTFVYMVGQHFDNLWLYAKAVTDKYDADNRLTHGISKDLVGEALKNFGVKLYTSNKSTEDLFSTFIGQAYQSGSEVINNYITGSLTGSNTPIQPSSYDGYQKEVQKRIYHNLPLLLKSKGTERGLRALINCFGIPSDILKIKLYGGRNINNLPFYGDYQYYTSSLDKIRTDHTGSITPGDTLSQYTSIVHRDYKYTDDLHNIEVGFSPTDNIDNYIQFSKQLPTVTIGTQVWTKYNLDVTRYANGDPIPQVINPTAWAGLTTGAWCYYSNNQKNNKTYGKLYNWYAVNDARGLAPQGYHIPTDTEWTALTTYLGGESVAGGKMKSTTLWNSPNTGATNSSGFTGLPGGYRLYDGTFLNINNDSYWWSSTSSSIDNAWARNLAYNSNATSRNGNSKLDGFVIRLIQDTLPTNTFNIDNYIGDPRDLTSNSYSGLYKVAENILENLDQYNLQDYVRLIKFFDNVIFKMVKDFIPARAIADTGIIIKPNLLNRSKAKSVSVSGSQPQYTASIDTAFIAASDGGVYEGSQILDTKYKEIIQTPIGLYTSSYHYQQEAKYDGELSGSRIIVSNGEWNMDNPYKKLQVLSANFNIKLISSSVGECTLRSADTLPPYISSGTPYGVDAFFQGVENTAVYTANGTTITFPYTFPTPTFTPYDPIKLTAFIPPTCGPASLTFQYGACDLYANTLEIDYSPNLAIDLTKYLYTNNILQQSHLQYFEGTAPIGNYTEHYFSAPNTTVTITLKDDLLSGCEKSMIINVLAEASLPPREVGIYYFQMNATTTTGLIIYRDSLGNPATLSLANAPYDPGTSNTVSNVKVPSIYKLIASRVDLIGFNISEVTNTYSSPPPKPRDNTPPESPKVSSGDIKLRSITFKNLSREPITISAHGYYEKGTDVGEFEFSVLLLPILGQDIVTKYINNENVIYDVRLYKTNTTPRFTFTPSIPGRLEVTLNDN